MTKAQFIATRMGLALKAIEAAKQAKPVYWGPYRKIGPMHIYYVPEAAKAQCKAKLRATVGRWSRLVRIHDKLVGRA